MVFRKSKNKMNSLEIDNFMRKCSTSKNWGGIYPSDKLPQFLCKKCNFGIIANTETSSEDGEHWVAFFFPESGIVEYFDSFGKKPNDKYFINFLSLQEVTFNNLKLQNDMSDSCGPHCIFFLMARFVGIPFENIVEFLKCLGEYADSFVKTYINVFRNKHV